MATVAGDGALSAVVDAVFEMMHVFSQIEVFSSRDIRQSINHGHGMGLTAFAFYKARLPTADRQTINIFFRRYEYPKFIWTPVSQ